MSPLHRELERHLRAAAAIALPYAGSGAALKGNGSAITEADLAVEDYLREALCTLEAGSRVLGEERGADPGSGPLWLVDPIDGTANFARGSAHWGISAALLDESEQPTTVAVYQPMLDRYWSATAGHGAWLNDQRVRCPDVPDAHSVVGLGLTGMAGSNRVPAALKRLAPRLLAVRIQGAAALDLSQVASGQLPVFFQQGLKCWDTGAGALIAAESGAVVTDFDGQPFRPLHSPSVLAATPSLHAVALAALA